MKIVILALTLLWASTASAFVELGANDRRLSFMGPSNDPDFDALHPDIAYNPKQNEYFVVWDADADSAGPPVQVNDEIEIFGTRLNSDGERVGPLLVISKSGPPGDADFDAEFPRVVHNPVTDQYLVVWMGEDTIDGDTDVYGRLMNADGTGGSVFFPISSMGTFGDTDAGVKIVMATYNSVDNEYMVVWTGDDTDLPENNSRLGIYGQRLDAAGNPIGTDDFQIFLSDTNGGAFAPYVMDVVHNPARNEYVILYSGVVNGVEREMFGLRFASDGALIGSPFRLSTMGPEGDGDYIAIYGKLAFNPDRGEYLAVWQGLDDRANLADNESEIFGQFFDESGVETGEDDFQISDGGMDGNASYGADVVWGLNYNPVDRLYVVLWWGKALSPYLDANEREFFGQFLNEDGAQVGQNDFRLSDNGPFGDASYGAPIGFVSVARNSQKNEYLAVWASDDTGTAIQPQVKGENEVFAQLFVSHVCGNGIAEPLEECDGTEACLDDCTQSSDSGATGGDTSGETGGTAGDSGSTDGGEDADIASGGCSLIL